MDRFVTATRPLAVLAGPLALASIALEFTTAGSPQGMASPVGLIAAVLAFLAVLGMLVGLIGLHTVQAQRSGTIGLTGLLVGGLGAVLTAGGVWTSIFVVPGLATAAPTVLETGLSTVLVGFVLSYGILGIGGLLTGIATLKAGVFSRSVAITMIVGGVLCLAPLPARYFMLAIAISIVAARQPASIRQTAAAT